jgi:hypothetical protein
MIEIEIQLGTFYALLRSPQGGPNTGLEARLNALKRAGVIGSRIINGKNIVRFYAASAGLGAMGSAAALWELGSALYTDIGADLAIWQAGDLEGFTSTMEMLYNLINAELVPEGVSQGAAFGALAGCLLWGGEPCPGVLRSH